MHAEHLISLNEDIVVKLREHIQHVAVNTHGRVDNYRLIRVTARKKVMNCKSKGQ